MPLTVIDHAVARVLLSRLRDIKTPSPEFRDVARSLSRIVALEAARTLATNVIKVETPLETTDGFTFCSDVVVMPILRAGLGMLESVLEILPQSNVGYYGLERNEETAVARLYYSKIPNVTGKSAWILDPMLATGGSASHAAAGLYSAGAADVTLLSIVAAPEGVAHLESTYPSLHIVTAALDRELNSKKYILPGLGDFGDRLYGTG